MSMSLRGLHESVRPAAEYALRIAQYYGVVPEITSTVRSWEDQRKLRDRYERCVSSGMFGRTPECRYPANVPGDSAHQFGLAWDSWVPAAQMPFWIAVRRYVGFDVPSHDDIHAEYPRWRQFVK